MQGSMNIKSIKIISAVYMFQPSWLIVKKYLKQDTTFYTHVHAHKHTVYNVCIKSYSVFIGCT